MEQDDLQRRARIAGIVGAIALMCVLCAIIIALSQGNDMIAFNTAQLVNARGTVNMWR